MVGADIGAKDCYGNTPSQIFDDHVTEPVLDEVRHSVLLALVLHNNLTLEVCGAPFWYVPVDDIHAIDSIDRPLSQDFAIKRFEIKRLFIENLSTQQSQGRRILSFHRVFFIVRFASSCER